MAEPLPLILASASPRRAALLKQAGIVPARIVAPEVDETPKKQELPRAYALRLALAKADAVARMFSRPQGEGGFIVLAADTVVACGRRILPKAEGPEEVARCLKLLSGRRHQVFTAVAAAGPVDPPPFTGEVLAQRAEGATASTETKPPFKIRTRIVMTRVAFKVLTTREIADYAASGEGEGKAGGYAIQGRAEAFVRFINGSYSNVVGLPLYETVAMLENWRIANSE